MTRRQSPTPPRGPVGLRSFGDESIRRLPDGDAVYVLAAAIVPETRCEPIRDLLRALLLGRQNRLHWRDEEPARRRKIVDAVADAGAASIVVVGARLVMAKQERGRRQALERLLWELDQRQVEHLLLESRQPERDGHDLRAIGGMRNARRVSRRLRVDHGQPVQEPLLWLPDAVCGAVGDSRCGVPEHQAVIEDQLALVEIEID